MGLSQQIGASSLIKPGVIDNAAARPASPFEGQVIFQKDTDQLLVYNGTAWVVPNSPAQNPTGLELVTPSSATNGTVGTTGTVTVGNAVSSVTVSGAFSSLYNAYKIILTGGAASAQGDIKMILGATVAGYYQNAFYTAWNNTVLAASTNNGASWERSGITELITPTLNVEIVNPFLTERTIISGPFVGTDSTRVGGFMSGFLSDTTSYTAFTITPITGTLTGGQITVYGYRI